MIFSSTFDKVMDGTKTQTRRPVKIGHGHISFSNRTEIEVAVKSYWNKNGKLVHRRMWKVGNTYAVQPKRGKKSEGRIKLLEIRREKLHDIKVIDCFKEGIEFPSWAEHIKFNSGKFELEIEEIFALHPYSWNALMLYGIDKFQELWESIYMGTKFAFEKNPDVWVLEFELVEKD